MRKAPLSGAGQGKDTTDCGSSSIARSNPCPHASDCRSKWIASLDRDDGAECGVCGNWLTRRTLVQLLAAA